MTKWRAPVPVFAGLAALAALTVTACYQEAERRCYADYKQSHHVLLTDRQNAHERLIALMTTFAKSNGMDHEANRYPRGVPGNTRPQFLVSACNEHFYALAGNQEPGFITVKMLSDRLQHEAGIDPLAVALTVQLKSEFQDVWLGSDFNDRFLEQSRANPSPAAGADGAKPGR